MNLPQANARLTAVVARGHSEDWDEGEEAGAERWAGTADAYVQQAQQQVRDGARDSTVVTRSIVLPPNVPVHVGDTLRLVWRETPVSWPVVAVTERVAPPGVPGTTVVEAQPS